MSFKQPIKHSVRYYTNSDAGAPAISNNNGAIKQILKACLVTGLTSKEGAGWQSLFEDGNRIILRRPLRTGSPPDIKIENGTNIHSIVSQDDPTGLDDPNQLASVNLLARDSLIGAEWHLMATDAGFVFCYQAGESAAAAARNNILYCGSVKKLQDTELDIFVTSYDSKVSSNGIAGENNAGVMGSSYYFKDMRSDTSTNTKSYLDLAVAEKYFNDDYFAQSIIVGNSFLLPFYCAMSSSYSSLVSAIVDIDGRPMLRYVNQPPRQAGKRVLYIPLDYMET